MVELERNMRKDAVHRELEHRSDRSDLEERNVLRMSFIPIIITSFFSQLGSSAVSMPIAAVASNLERSMKKDAVSRGLKDRPTHDELVNSGIERM